MTAARQRPPTHPGALLRQDVLPALGVSVAAAARNLGISRQALQRILAERAPVTPAMALRLDRYCGNGPDFGWPCRASVTFGIRHPRTSIHQRRISNRNKMWRTTKILIDRKSCEK